MKVCKIEGCEKAAKTKGFCPKHYMRLWTHGDPLFTKIRAYGGGSPTHRDGYITIGCVGHPVAQKSGHAYQHRVVLYDAIGPGMHPCHHCGKPLTWFAKVPQRLEVDHLDFDRTNNDPTNLVPSCRSCNIASSNRHRHLEHA